jgi:nucleoside-diphosphate-sugar epimerase
MNVLVIGGTRFVGYLVVWRLLARGERVTLLNRGTRPDPFGTRVERLEGDRRSDLARLVAGKSFDAVVDFAAYEGRDVAAAVETLATGHYVFVSTGQVYLVREGCPRPAREGDYDGPVMPRPTDPHDGEEWDYGAGKRACEDVLAAAAGFPSTRIRMPVVNGERDASRRLESYLWRILDGGPVLLPDGGGHRLRHVYSADVARAIVGLLGERRTFGQAYNLANEETPTLAELVALLTRLLGAPLRAASVPASRVLAAELTPRGVSPFSSAWQSFLDPARAKRELGWAATPLEAQMASIVASFLASMPAHPPEGYAMRSRELELVGAHAPA